MIEARYMREPDYVSPPGVTLAALLEAKEITLREFAESIGWPQEQVSNVLTGEAAITETMASQLEEELDVPANFWRQREEKFRKFKEQQEWDEFRRRFTVEQSYSRPDDDESDRVRYRRCAAS